MSETLVEIRDRVFRLGSGGKIEVCGQGFDFTNCEFIALPERSTIVTAVPIIIGLSGELGFKGCRFDGNGMRAFVRSVGGIRINGCELIGGSSPSDPVIIMESSTSACGLACDNCSFIACTTVGEVLVSSAGGICMRNCQFEACNVQGDLVRLNRMNGKGEFENCTFKDCAAAFHLLSSGDVSKGVGKNCISLNCSAVDSIFSHSQDDCFDGKFIVSGEMMQFK